MFPLEQIVLTAAMTALGSGLVLMLLRWRSSASSLGEVLTLSLVAGVSVLVWRLAGNVASLNDDPIPLVSPNDVLAPMVTYISMGLLAAVRLPRDDRQWRHQRALLTLVSFVANVVFI